MIQAKKAPIQILDERKAFGLSLTKYIPRNDAKRMLKDAQNNRESYEK